MTRRTVGLLLLLGASELVGLLLGQWFYSLFLKTVPPLAMSSFNQGAAHLAFIFYGVVAGVAFFLLCLLAVVLSRFFGEPAPGEKTSDSGSERGSALRGGRS